MQKQTESDEKKVLPQGVCTTMKKQIIRYL